MTSSITEMNANGVSYLLQGRHVARPSGSSWRKAFRVVMAQVITPLSHCVEPHTFIDADEAEIQDEAKRVPIRPVDSAVVYTAFCVYDKAILMDGVSDESITSFEHKEGRNAHNPSLARTKEVDNGPHHEDLSTTGSILPIHPLRPRDSVCFVVVVAPTTYSFTSIPCCREGGGGSAPAARSTHVLRQDYESPILSSIVVSKRLGHLEAQKKVFTLVYLYECRYLVLVAGGGVHLPQDSSIHEGKACLSW
jgi:hypothetical protein